MSSTPDREPSTDESLLGSSSPSPSPPTREPSTDEFLFGSPLPQSLVLPEGTIDEMTEYLLYAQENAIGYLADGKSPEIDFGAEDWAPSEQILDNIKQHTEVINAVYASIEKPEKGRYPKRLKDKDPQFDLRDAVNRLRIRERKLKTFDELSEDQQNVIRIQGRRFIAEEQARRDKKSNEAESLEVKDANKSATAQQNEFFPNTQPQMLRMPFQQSQRMSIPQTQPISSVQQTQPMYLQTSQPMPLQPRQHMDFQQIQPMSTSSSGVGNVQNRPGGVFDDGIVEDADFDWSWMG